MSTSDVTLQVMVFAATESILEPHDTFLVGMTKFPTEATYRRISFDSQFLGTPSFMVKRHGSRSMS